MVPARLLSLLALLLSLSLAGCYVTDSPLIDPEGGDPIPGGPGKFRSLSLKGETSEFELKEISNTEGRVVYEMRADDETTPVVLKKITDFLYAAQVPHSEGGSYDLVFVYVNGAVLEEIKIDLREVLGDAVLEVTVLPDEPDCYKVRNSEQKTCGDLEQMAAGGKFVLEHRKFTDSLKVADPARFFEAIAAKKDEISYAPPYVRNR